MHADQLNLILVIFPNIDFFFKSLSWNNFEKEMRIYNRSSVLVLSYIQTFEAKLHIYQNNVLQIPLFMQRRNTELVILSLTAYHWT